MGKKAKLKKQRKEAVGEYLTDPKKLEPTQFVKQLAQKGYTLQQSLHSPEIPRNNIEPQV